MSLPPDIADEIAAHLEAIQALFTAVKVTLIVRDPTHPDGSRDLVMTDDHLGHAIRALEIRRAAAAAERLMQGFGLGEAERRTS